MKYTKDFINKRIKKLKDTHKHLCNQYAMYHNKNDMDEAHYTKIQYKALVDVLEFMQLELDGKLDA